MHNITIVDDDIILGYLNVTTENSSLLKILEKCKDKFDGTPISKIDICELDTSCKYNHTIWIKAISMLNVHHIMNFDKKLDDEQKTVINCAMILAEYFMMDDIIQKFKLLLDTIYYVNINIQLNTCGDSWRHYYGVSAIINKDEYIDIIKKINYENNQYLKFIESEDANEYDFIDIKMEEDSIDCHICIFTTDSDSLYYDYDMYVRKEPWNPKYYKDIFNNNYIDIVNEFEAGIANLYQFEYDYTRKKPTLEDHKQELGRIRKNIS